MNLTRLLLSSANAECIIKPMEFAPKKEVGTTGYAHGHFQSKNLRQNMKGMINPPCVVLLLFQKSSLVAPIVEGGTGPSAPVAI